MQNLGKIAAKKSLGQHFLNNTRVPSQMADAALVAKGDIVVEIGPGTGVLTRELLNRRAQVIAIEIDDRAIESLHESFNTEITAQKLTIIKHDIGEGDIASLDFIPKHYKVVANIPYYLSGRLFRIFLESEKQPSCLVFLVQKEVAERIARDTKESLLSLSVKAYGVPQYIKTVARGNFTPQPKVDSAIIAITDIARKNFAVLDEKWFFSVLHAGLGSKRKQLLGNLSKIISKDTLIQTFSELHISSTIRGEDLPLEKWLELADVLHTKR